MGVICYNDKIYGAGGGASSLAQLSDVDISNLQNGQSLVWNATTQKWENKMISGGSQLEAEYGQFNMLGIYDIAKEGIINE